MGFGNSQNWSSIRTIQSKVCFNQFLFCYILFYYMLTKNHCISKKRVTFLDSFITVRSHSNMPNLIHLNSRLLQIISSLLPTVSQSWIPIYCVPSTMTSSVLYNSSVINAVFIRGLNASDFAFLLIQFGNLLTILNSCLRRQTLIN